MPALHNNHCDIAIDEEDFEVITKPHGHGDVHTLLYNSGIANRWASGGKKWMIFIQDTNALALKAIPSFLGVTAKNNWEMNTLAVNRKPGEKCGGLCKLNEYDEKGNF